MNQTPKNVMSNQNVNEEKMPRLQLAEPISFDSHTSNKVTTTLQLALMVNALFQSVPDYEGCIVKPDQMTGMLGCTLFFKLLPEQQKYSCCISSDSTVKGGDVLAKYSRISARNQSRKLMLTDMGKKLISPFMINPGRKEWNKYNWNQVVQEVTDGNPQYGGVQTPYLRVQNIDLYKILPVIFSDLEDTAMYQYNLFIIKPIGMIGFGDSNFLINITRLNVSEVEELCKEVGFLPTTGTLPIVRV